MVKSTAQLVQPVNLAGLFTDLNRCEQSGDFEKAHKICNKSKFFLLWPLRSTGKNSFGIQKKYLPSSLPSLPFQSSQAIRTM